MRTVFCRPHVWLGVVVLAALAACSGGSNTATPAAGDNAARAGTFVRAKGFTWQLADNAGGPAVGTFGADADYQGGQTASTTSPIDTSGVMNPAPQAVYQTDRYGTFSYEFGGASPNEALILRLHFAELVYSAPGARVFNVTVNGTRVLSNFDIYAVAGAMDKAVVEQFPVQADSHGNISVAFTPSRTSRKSMASRSFAKTR